MNKAGKEKSLFRIINDGKKCVFISHKKEDEHIAKVLGEFIEKSFNFDIYLDILDTDLREAVSVENDKKIVESIIRGLKCSNILLCIISDKTKLSWWVPYEIGMADNLGLKIASIRVKTIDDLPSFLKVKETLDDINELVEFLLKNRRYGALFYSKEDKNNIIETAASSLQDYFDYHME